MKITETAYDSASAYRVTSNIGRAPVFLQSLMPNISKAGDIVTLKCTVTATPMPSATWFVNFFKNANLIWFDFYLYVYRYKNGQEIQVGGRCLIFNDQNGTYSLVISDALPQDSGSYEITVRNQYGTANSKTNLQILGKRSIYS